MATEKFVSRIYHELKKTNDKCWDQKEGWMGIPWYSIRERGLGLVRRNLAVVPVRSIYEGLREAIGDAS